MTVFWVPIILIEPEGFLLPSLKLTASLPQLKPLKMDGWKMIHFPLGRQKAYFRLQTMLILGSVLPLSKKGFLKNHANIGEFHQGTWNQASHVFR